MTNNASLLLVLLLINIFVVVFNLIIFLTLKKRRKALDKKEKEISKNEGEIEDKAQLEVKEIMETALKKASEILHETEAVKENMESKYATQVEMVSNKKLSLFEEELEKMLKKSQLEIEGSKGRVTEIMEDYLKKETENELGKVRQDIENYKTEKIKEIDGSVKQIVDQVVEEVMGNGFTLNDQEKIVTVALEKAKTEHLFVSK
jgi:F0F1-type ATP synthase membrane subunit b/b'